MTKRAKSSIISSGVGTRLTGIWRKMDKNNLWKNNRHSSGLVCRPGDQQAPLKTGMADNVNSTLKHGHLRSLVRDIPDFPSPGVLFRDITPLLQDKEAFSYSVTAIARGFRTRKVDLVASVESRGFIIGAAVAASLSCGFIPVRKKGKLPFNTFSADYGLEYGSGTLEVHVDACQTGQRVLVVDDVLATGGTARATIELLRRGGAEVVGAAFLIHLKEFEATNQLDVPTLALLSY